MIEKLLLRKNRMKTALCAIIVASASYLNPATVFGQTSTILYADPAYTIPKNVFERGDVVYARSTGLSTTDYYNHTVSPPTGFGSDQVVGGCQIGSTTLESSFPTAGVPLSTAQATCTSPTTAQVQAAAYKYRLKAFGLLTDCQNGSPTKGTIQPVLFRVVDAYPFESAADRDACLSDVTCDENVVASFCPGDNVFMAIRGYIPCNTKVGHQFIRPDGTTVGPVMELGTTASGNLYLPSFTIPSGSADYLGQWEIKVGPIITVGGVHSFRTDASNPANTVILDAFNVDVSNIIDARKYYDLNMDGVRQNDGTEPWLEGWEMTLSGDATGVEYTDADGHAFFTGLPNGSFTVTEGTLPNWIATDGISKNVNFDEVVCGIEKNRRFGNVCIDAKSKGFWGNKNGLAIIRATNLCRLRNLCLRNEDGTLFPTTITTTCPVANPAQAPTAAELKAFDQFLQKANSKNALNMLSAQLAAMALNILHMNVDPASLIYAPGTDAANTLGFASITAVMQEAITLLCGDADGKIMAGDIDRARALALISALDGANTNQNFLQETPCEINFLPNGSARVAANSATSVEGASLTTYPNPLTDKTTISYTLNEAANVSLIVYDGFGRQVAVLHSGEKAAGKYDAEWNAGNLASGIYFCRLTANTENGQQQLQTTKMILIK